MAAKRSGRGLPALLVCLVLLGTGTTSGAAPRVDVGAEVGTELLVWATNGGDETVEAVVPELLYQHRRQTGEVARLLPGGRQEWRFPLAPAPGSGTFPATIRVRWTGPHGRRSTPLVALVSTPDAQPSTVRVRLEATNSIAPVGGARLVLQNPGSRPIAGRVVLILPGGLDTEPESMPAEVPAAGQTEIPIVLENAGGLPPDAYRAYVVFGYADGTRHATALAEATLDVAPEGGGRARPLVVGAGALAMSLVLLAVAWRTAARREEVRPDNRPDRTARPTGQPRRDVFP